MNIIEGDVIPAPRTHLTLISRLPPLLALALPPLCNIEGDVFPAAIPLLLSGLGVIRRDNACVGCEGGPLPAGGAGPLGPRHRCRLQPRRDTNPVEQPGRWAGDVISHLPHLPHPLVQASCNLLLGKGQSHSLSSFSSRRCWSDQAMI